MTPTIIPLDATLGAQVTDVDLQALDEATWQMIEKAFFAYALLLFPGQHLTAEAQNAFGRRFGALLIEALPISNATPDGGVLGPETLGYWILRGNEYWHHDSSCMPVAAKASILTAKVLPASGGETGWADTRAAYDALDAPTRTHLATLRACHSNYYSHAQLGQPARTGAFPSFHTYGAPVRSLVKHHPVTGKPALYTGRHAYGGSVADWYCIRGDQHAECIPIDEQSEDNVRPLDRPGKVPICHTTTLLYSSARAPGKALCDRQLVRKRSGVPHTLRLLQAGRIHAQIHHRCHLGEHRHHRLEEIWARRGLDFLLGHRPKQLEPTPRTRTKPLRLAPTCAEVPVVVIVFRARDIRPNANAKPLAQEPAEVAWERFFTQRFEQDMPVPIFFDGDWPVFIRVLRGAFDLHAGVEATLGTINRDIEFCGAKVLPGAARLRPFVGFWHPAEPLPVHASPPSVTEHPHPISFFQPTLQDLGQPLFDRQVPHANAAIEVEVRTAEGPLAIHTLARKRIRFVSDAAHCLSPSHQPGS